MSRMELANLALPELGARVVRVSSASVGYEAHYVLDPREDLLWMSEAAPPQEIIVQLAPRDVPILSIGIYTWHEYTTNPRTISLQVARSSLFPDLNKAPFREWCVLNCALMRRQQMFPVPAIPKEYDAFRFVILENFGGDRVYLNQIFLYADLHPDTTFLRSFALSPQYPHSQHDQHTSISSSQGGTTDEQRFLQQLPPVAAVSSPTTDSSSMASNVSITISPNASLQQRHVQSPILSHSEGSVKSSPKDEETQTSPQIASAASGVPIINPEFGVQYPSPASSVSFPQAAPPQQPPRQPYAQASPPKPHHPMTSASPPLTPLLRSAHFAAEQQSRQRLDASEIGLLQPSPLMSAQRPPLSQTRADQRSVRTELFSPDSRHQTSESSSGDSQKLLLFRQLSEMQMAVQEYVRLKDEQHMFEQDTPSETVAMERVARVPDTSFVQPADADFAQRYVQSRPTDISSHVSNAKPMLTTVPDEPAPVHVSQPVDLDMLSQMATSQRDVQMSHEQLIQRVSALELEVASVVHRVSAVEDCTTQLLAGSAEERARTISHEAQLKEITAFIAASNARMNDVQTGMDHFRQEIRRSASQQATDIQSRPPTHAASHPRSPVSPSSPPAAAAAVQPHEQRMSTLIASTPPAPSPAQETSKPEMFADLETRLQQWLFDHRDAIVAHVSKPSSPYPRSSPSSEANPTPVFPEDVSPIRTRRREDMQAVLKSYDNIPLRPSFIKDALRRLDEQQSIDPDVQKVKRILEKLLLKIELKQERLRRMDDVKRRVSEKLERSQTRICGAETEQVSTHKRRSHRSRSQTTVNEFQSIPTVPLPRDTRLMLAAGGHAPTMSDIDREFESMKDSYRQRHKSSCMRESR